MTLEAPPGDHLALGDRLALGEATVLAAVLAGAMSHAEPEHREITSDLVHDILARFSGLLPGGGAAGSSLDVVRAAGHRYADCGVSYAQALLELHRTIIEMSRQWWAAVPVSDVGALLQVSQAVEGEVGPMRTALSDGYCAGLAASGTRSLGRRQLAECLFDGGRPGAMLLRAANVQCARQYLLLSTVAPEQAVEDEVPERLGVPGTLARRAADRLDVLVPIGPRALVAGAGAGVAVRAFSRLSALTGASVAGAAVAPVDRLPVALGEARSTLDIASACGRSGAVFADQVLVERAMTGSTEALQQLAGVVEALASWPHLAPTLSALYDNDLDRSATAADLHIARRTLSKRLERIHQMTGLHPTSARGVQTFLSALAAERLVAPRDGTQETPDPIKTDAC